MDTFIFMCNHYKISSSEVAHHFFKLPDNGAYLLRYIKKIENFDNEGYTILIELIGEVIEKMEKHRHEGFESENYCIYNQAFLCKSMLHIMIGEVDVGINREMEHPEDPFHLTILAEALYHAELYEETLACLNTIDWPSAKKGFHIQRWYVLYANVMDKLGRIYETREALQYYLSESHTSKAATLLQRLWTTRYSPSDHPEDYSEDMQYIQQDVFHSFSLKEALYFFLESLIPEDSFFDLFMLTRIKELDTVKEHELYSYVDTDNWNKYESIAPVALLIIARYLVTHYFSSKVQSKESKEKNTETYYKNLLEKCDDIYKNTNMKKHRLMTEMISHEEFLQSLNNIDFAKFEKWDLSLS